MQRRGSSVMGLWIALGAGVGTAIGVTSDDLAIWLAVGIGAGTAIGAALSSRKRD